MQQSEIKANIAIGKKLRFYRTLAGKSQEEVGEYLGITFQQIQKYERGMNAIRGAKIISLASYFGVSTDALLGVSAKHHGHDYELDRVTGQIMQIVTGWDDARKRVLLDFVRTFG